MNIQLLIIFGTIFGYGLLQVAEKQNFRTSEGEEKMLETIIVVLLVLWLIGFFGFSAQIGGLVHILLLIALVVLVIRLVSGRRVV